MSLTSLPFVLPSNVQSSAVGAGADPNAGDASLYDIIAKLISPSFTNLLISGLFSESFTDNITAHAGGGQASAVQLTTELNRVATVTTAADSVKLPASVAGLTIVVTNHGSNPMQVFGLGTDTIDDVAAATGVSHMQNSMVIYSCYTAGAWYTEGLANGFVRGYSLATQSSAVIAANSGGTQGTGTPITAMNNAISSGGAGYSATLPASSPGMQITVHNTSGTNTMAVFPATGETINGLATNTALSFPVNTSTTLYCTTTGQWYSNPRTPS